MIKMKALLPKLLFLGVFVLNTFQIKAQNNDFEATQVETDTVEASPAIFKFEPNFMVSEKQRKKEIDLNRQILDTLDISERKRKRLLRDLYKNGESKRLNKVLVADTKFDDEED